MRHAFSVFGGRFAGNSKNVKIFRRRFCAAVNMKIVTSAVENVSNTIIDGLHTKGWAVVDGLLEDNSCFDMRDEAVELFEEGYYSI